MVFSWLCALAVVSASPQVALVSSPAWGSESSLHFQSLDDTAWSAPAVTFSHEKGAAVKSAVLPGTRTVLAVVQVYPAKDESWASGLLRLTEGEAPVMLADRVYHATRPLVAAQGRVFITRGKAGAEPSAADIARGRLRVDELTVEEINPRTGEARVVFEARGYLAFLAGALGRELLVYLVEPASASLWAVTMDEGHRRPLLSKMPPFARDFSVDAQAKRLLFTQWDASSQKWAVQAVGVEDGQLKTLATDSRITLLPTALPDGTVFFNGGQRPLSSLGKGPDELQAFSADGTFGAGVHHEEDRFPQVFVLNLQRQTVWTPPPADTGHVDFSGFVEGVSR